MLVHCHQKQATDLSMVCMCARGAGVSSGEILGWLSIGSSLLVVWHAHLSSWFSELTTSAYALTHVTTG